MSGSPKFRRPHHNAVAQLLTSLNAAFLLDCACFFGGGTAIALSLDE
jgi:hypothetical protein